MPGKLKLVSTVTLPVVELMVMLVGASTVNVAVARATAPPMSAVTSTVLVPPLIQ